MVTVNVKYAGLGPRAEDWQSLVNDTMFSLLIVSLLRPVVKLKEVKDTPAQRQN